MIRRLAFIAGPVAALLIAGAPTAVAATSASPSASAGVPMPYLLGAAAIGVLVAWLAHRAGRNPVGWFLVGFLLGLIGLVVFLVAEWWRKRKGPVLTPPIPAAPPTTLPARPDSGS